ncbi:uncharacterized protein LOC115631321 [Scaptodrosophila lebanonensis]|uniref:Uncharacterized protein LOC115631321 n=1 Tax=Drosophila lebanonensis TaxID=7225 RepID=A0A6J2U7F3_DROLE|nr:uncharacterized protein LOC115631321 [Scaptodrosophila lebanonensis]
MTSLWSYLAALLCSLSFAVANCPQGFTPVGRKCLYFETLKLDWRNAQNRCASYNADLIAFANQQEVNDLSTHLNAISWPSNCPLDSIWTLSAGPPGPTNKCVAVCRKARRSITLEDFSCNTLFASACQWRGGLGPPTQGPPTQGPPTQGPPTQGPPTQGPPTQGPPINWPPTEVPPGQAPPLLAKGRICVRQKNKNPYCSPLYKYNPWGQLL